MSRRAPSVLAVVIVALLSACTAAPPSVRDYTDADVAQLVLLEEAGDARAVSLADYRDAQLADAPAVQPESCRNSVGPLVLFAQDEAAEGTVFQPPPVFRDIPGADLAASVFARRFPSAADAEAFVDALRAERSACPAFDTASGTHVEQSVVEGDFTVPAVGFSFAVTPPGGDASASFEWILRTGNVAIAVDAATPDPETVEALRALAADYAQALTDG
jgi:hypothetical protein